MRKPESSLNGEHVIGLLQRAQNGDQMASAEVARLLAQEFRMTAAGKHYLPISKLRGGYRQYLKEPALGRADEALIHRIGCDVIVSTMASSEVAEVARVGKILASLLESLEAEDPKTALLLRLRYIAGLNWEEITGLPAFEGLSTEQGQAAADMVTALTNHGISEELLAEHGLGPRGEVTQLLGEVQKGSRPLGDVVAHERGKLLKQAEHLLRMERDGISIQADDLVNEMYLRLPRTPEKTPLNHFEFDALTKRIMRHVLIDRIRKPVPGQARISGELSEHLSKPAGLEERMFQEKVVRVVQKLIEELRVSDRETADMLKAALFRGADQKEIAKLHSVSVSTVKRRLKDAREQIRVRLGLE
jgi:RNA polymerase sigma factor (sigma-70 family)